MNIINRFFLHTVLLPSSFYERIGVDTKQLKAILTTKLTMDDRRPPALRQMQRRKKDKPVSMATIGTMFVSALFGLFYLLLFSIGANVVTQLTFYFTAFFVMLSLTLIADFTSVLIDVRDNLIILPKPVNDRTFVVARLLHIFIHVCKIVLPMSLPAMVLMAVRYNVGALLIFIPLQFLLTAFSIFFINALYLVMLKLTTPQRFQSIIGTVQIVFAIVMYGSYQIFPRMLSWVDLNEFDISAKTGIAFYPLYWLAQSWNVFYHLGGQSFEIAFAAAGILFPVACVFVVVKYLAPSFNRKLALITATTGSETSAKQTKTVNKKAYSRFWSRLLTNSKVEKASFEFTWKMTSRSRDFKLKVYPSMGYIVVYVFVILFGNKRFSFHNLQEVTTQSKVLIISALYFTSLLLTMAITQMAYSDKFKASWIFYTSPLTKPGEMIAGATKAVIAKFYLPLVLIVTVIGLVIAGPEILPNIVFGLFNQVLIASTLVYIGHKYFPFSVHQSNSVKTGSFLRGFFILIISGAIATGHFLLYSILPAIVLCAALSVLASWLIFDTLKKTSWEKIASQYAEE